MDVYHSVWLRCHVEVIKKSKDVFTSSQLSCHWGQGSVLPQTEEEGHQRVSLFAPLRPVGCGSRPRTHPPTRTWMGFRRTFGETATPSLHRACRKDLASWRCGRSSRMLPPRQLTRSLWLRPSPTMCGVCGSRIRILPSFSEQTDAERWPSPPDHRSVGLLFLPRSGKTSPTTIPRTPPSAFAKAVTRPSLRAPSALGGTYNTEQRNQTGVILEDGVKVFGCHARRAYSTTDVADEPAKNQFQRRLRHGGRKPFRSGMGSRGTGGRHWRFVNARNVANVPGATRALSSAWWPTDISPHWTNFTTLTALASTVSELWWRRLRTKFWETCSAMWMLCETNSCQIPPWNSAVGKLHLTRFLSRLLRASATLSSDPCLELERPPTERSPVRIPGRAETTLNPDCWPKSAGGVWWSSPTIHLMLLCMKCSSVLWKINSSVKSSRGCARRRLVSCRAWRVSVSPGARLAPSRACRAEESSPISALTWARAARRSTVSVWFLLRRNWASVATSSLNCNNPNHCPFWEFDLPGTSVTPPSTRIGSILSWTKEEISSAPVSSSLFFGSRRNPDSRMHSGNCPQMLCRPISSATYFFVVRICQRHVDNWNCCALQQIVLEIVQQRGLWLAPTSLAGMPLDDVSSVRSGPGCDASPILAPRYPWIETRLIARLCWTPWMVWVWTNLSLRCPRRGTTLPSCRCCFLHQPDDPASNARCLRRTWARNPL